MPMPPTLGDIAARAGVTKSTASKALHPQADRYHLSDEVRARVRQAADALGWDPDPRRRAAARERTHTVSLLFAQHQWFSLGVWTDLAGRIAGELAPLGYRLAYAPVPDGLAAWKRGMHHHSCDAGILIDPLPTQLEVAPSLGLPLVVFNEQSALPLPHVIPDEAQGVRLALDHLHGLGHRRVAFVRIASDSDHWSGPARRSAFLRHGAELGLACELILDADLARLVARLALSSGPTAVLTYCHVDAVLLLQACWAAGVRVPQHVSVVTIDRTWYTQFTCPALTCVEVPVVAMAQLAVRLAMDGIAGSLPAGRTEHALPPALVVGGSTGPPRAMV